MVVHEKNDFPSFKMHKNIIYFINENNFVIICLNNKLVPSFETVDSQPFLNL